MARLAFVVQRYGREVNGGAELHCRMVAEHMARNHEVEVLTSRALDYISWQDHYRDKTETIDGVLVRRFSVKQTRDERRFGLISEDVFGGTASLQKQRLWLREQGPFVPDLIDHLKRNIDRYDFIIPFSFRYYHSHECVKSFPEKSILVPTAEPDPAVNLKVFGSTFNHCQVVLYNTPESRDLIQEAQQNHSVPGLVTGVGIENTKPGPIPDVLRKHSLEGKRYIIYVGRIDQNKGCKELFDFFLSYLAQPEVPETRLVLLGNNVIEVPQHPKIRHLGFVSPEDKLALIKAADLLVMPSFLESLSIVLLEAWSCRTPVLANGRSDVLRGQCCRANGGLYYRGREEFIVCLKEMLSNRFLRKRLGSLGNKYFRLNYSWDVITEKYERAFEITKRNARSGQQAASKTA